jgi:threonine/homoserine/homoserine lactone efflux protein
MDTTRLLVFAAAYLAVLVLPGPGVTALVARVLARGLRARRRSSRGSLPRAIRLANRGSSVVMAGAALSIAAR